MKKKILVLTMSKIQSVYEANRVEEEAKKMGLEVNRRIYREMRFDLAKNKVFIGNDEVCPENYYGVWFRVAGTISGKYVEGRNLMIRMLRDKMFLANSEGYLNWPRMGKISQHGVFIANNIPVVGTKIFYTKEQVMEAKERGELKFPIIVKHERGYQGKSVRKIEGAKGLDKFLKRVDEVNLGMYLWQDYLPTKWDIRVPVIGGKAIGAMKRIAVGKEFRSNFSLGGDVENWELSEADRELAEKVAKVCGLDYCGVDIMKDLENTSYILEVNRACQFQGFEKATGINVAKTVIEMITGK